MSSTHTATRSAVRPITRRRRTLRRLIALVLSVGAVVALGVVALGVAHLLRPATESGPDGRGGVGDTPAGQAPVADAPPAGRSPVADAPPSDGSDGDDGPATGLDPELERRFALAQAAAAEAGVELTLTSGWRTAAEQQALVDDAIRRYGSVEEAHRWVLPPEASEHVAGRAIDVGPTEGAYWLEQHGAEFGLCRTYANEIWHYEATIEPGGTCGAMYPDASHGWD